MNAKQKKIRVFELYIDNEEKFYEYMNKNLILLKDYLLLVDGNITESIINFLEENLLCYILKTDCNLRTIQTSQQKEQVQPNKTPQTTKKVEIIKEVIYQDREIDANTLVINKPIRSGAIVENESDIVVFSRVNSGAKVIGESNVSIFGEIDGVVEANGEYLVIKSINKGYVIFNGDILEKDNFDGSLKKVIKTKDGYKVEDL